MSGLTNSGKTFTGHFDVSQFVTQGRQDIRAWDADRKRRESGRHQEKNVAIPASIGTGTIRRQQGPSGCPAGTCPILHLDLGPLNLNLLGLTVHLNEVVLDITAVSGPGNLLGNLLCSVANLLNGTGFRPGQQSAQEITGS